MWKQGHFDAVVSLDTVEQHINVYLRNPLVAAGFGPEAANNDLCFLDVQNSD